jgi:hypothetical protein
MLFFTKHSDVVLCFGEFHESNLSWQTSYSNCQNYAKFKFYHQRSDISELTLHTKTSNNNTI